jgi:hypothetical protein
MTYGDSYFAQQLPLLTFQSIYSQRIIVITGAEEGGETDSAIFGEFQAQHPFSTRLAIKLTMPS